MKRTDIILPEGLLEEAKTLLRRQNKPVLMENEYRKILRPIIPYSIKQRVITEALIKNGFLQKRTLKSDAYTDVNRISIPSLNPTSYHFAVSLRVGAYLSHGSAVQILGLSQQQLNTIFVNKEQTEKNFETGILQQELIDKAFLRPQRRSNYIFKLDGQQIVLLSGKFSKNAGVISDPHTNLPVTCLERTLIDITVRPRYAGGVFQVAQIFKKALSELDIGKLISLLKNLDYSYPYHQSIGFYLGKAGIEQSKLEIFKKMGIRFDFYLDYAMAQKEFDASWRVFYPLGV